MGDCPRCDTGMVRREAKEKCPKCGYGQAGAGMPFAEARSTVMSFGRFKGQILDKIAETDDGLQYLDWVRGNSQNVSPSLNEALSVYLDDPTIANDLNKLIRKH
jgi:hypothetical protein